MPATRTDGTTLVRAARAGDRDALEELVAAHLPMVYALTAQALDGHPDVDDVVQDVMVRALRQLPSLRSPESFRPWLTAIALRQISTHQLRMRQAAQRTAAVEEAERLPGAGFEGLTHLRLELSDQRRQVRQAARWLDAGDRALLALWWLEVAGRLSRSELAEALGVTVSHAGVRIQRMRGQLDLARGIEAAVGARPVCPGLAGETAGWDGTPGPLWRKRLARHLQSCRSCRREAEDLLPADRLLAGLVLIPVPATVTAAVLANWTPENVVAGLARPAVSASGAAADRARWLGARIRPAVVAVVAGALAIGAAVAVLTAPDEPEATAPAPAPAVPAVPTGPVALESANTAGRYVTVSNGAGVLATARDQATFQAVAGLADPDCLSLRTADGRYLRHESWRLRVHEDVGTNLFHGDATFCVRAGSIPGSVALESSNYPGWFLRHRGNELWVDQSDDSAAFRADGSFLIRPAAQR
ncbi:sigma-70 family RNA polymerase sigma factor [Actinoplanes flavus]|uniref:RNA polymerase sigma factor n=1 Tax=Actinoplanes flavus TaxID=2820290 RepID=A0ABS3UCL5_9ACTN|nr:sigma-70 family RNA polymerase sigma factor [Actinoplanes flavus]MBO3736510.1 sigma-70 family RNA polymerase sigma factor [Actinoplanes flavus]